MIILRLDKNGGINKGDIKAFEHDNKSETYIIQLYKNNEVYDLTNKTVELTIVEKKRKYGDMVTLPVESATEGKVKLEIVSSITKQDGTYDFKLTVKDTAGLIETFPNFQVKIDTDITKNIAGEIVADKNFTILTEGLKALSEYEVYKTNAKKVPDIEKNVADLGSQLDNIENYQDQEDYVKSLSSQMSINKMSFLCNDIETGNYSIFYDVGNTKAIGYYTEKQMTDDYIILKGGRYGDLGIAYITVNSIAYSRKEGNFNETYQPNYYATTKGDKLYYDNITNTNGLDYFSYVDNRGGKWKFTLSCIGENDKVIILSVYSSQAGHKSQVMFRNLDRQKTYNLVCEFLGDDENNIPSGGSGTSRGWYVVNNGSVAYNSLLFKHEIISIINSKFPLQPQSNKDFAFLLKKKGATYTEQFFPLHSSVKTSYNTNNPKILIDGIDVTSSLSNLKSLDVKNNVTLIQKVYCKIPDDINTILGVMTSKHIFKNDGTVEILNSFKVMEDISIKSGYVNMFPINTEICPFFKTSFMNKYNINKSTGYTDLSEKDKCISYIAGGGSENVCVAMTTINPYSSLRKGKSGRKNPLIWIEHRNSSFSKLYPQVFQNGEMLRNEVYNFGCKFIVCVSDELNSLYMDM